MFENIEFKSFEEFIGDKVVSHRIQREKELSEQKMDLKRLLDLVERYPSLKEDSQYESDCALKGREVKLSEGSVGNYILMESICRDAVREALKDIEGAIPNESDEDLLNELIDAQEKIKVLEEKVKIQEELLSSQNPQPKTKTRVDPVKGTFGDWVRTCRKAAGLTIKDMSEKVGIIPQRVSKWENGESFPSNEVKARSFICKVIEVCKVPCDPNGKTVESVMTLWSSQRRGGKTC